jgi:hypothetical protein
MEESRDKKLKQKNNMFYIIVEDDGAINTCGPASMSFSQYCSPQKNIYKLPEIDNVIFKDFLKLLSKSRKNPRVIFQCFKEEVKDFSNLSEEDFMRIIYSENKAKIAKTRNEKKQDIQENQTLIKCICK